MNNLTINKNIYKLGLGNFYSIDGNNNNPQNSHYGSVGSTLLNIVPLDYGDRISSPAGEDRPNARVISNTLAQQNEFIESDRGLTNFAWAFGQFLDHDIILTPENSELEVTIPVPPGDSFLDPQNTGTVSIPLDATAFIEGTGTDVDNPAQIANDITAWIDGSNIYGSDLERSDYLRSGKDGKLKVSQGNLLPFGDESFDNANPSRQDPNNLFAAGDVRANENSVLVSLHTLFVREHNLLAEELAIAHPRWTDDQLFERARQINIAQYQSIVYNEYLPSILGTNALPAYSGYDSDINPSIDRSFSSAAFRIGHTQLSSEILRLDPEGKEITAGNLELADAFFRPVSVVQESGIDPILRGISSSLSQNVDLKLIDDVRNLLFTFGEHNSGRDLFAINVERGRLNGINDYNSVREAYGLGKVNSFDDITSNVEVQEQLSQLYGTVDNIDLFVGLLSEDHLPGTAVGQTFQTILREQFLALREGDRFYYENIFTPLEIAEIENKTLADIIQRNTDTTIIQDNAFTLLNRGTSGSDKIDGGLGNDSIYGGRGNDVITGFQGDDFLSGGAGNDFILGMSGKDTLEGGRGSDAYQLDLDSAGSEVRDSSGFDYLFITSDDVNLDSIDIQDASSFGVGAITLSQPRSGIIGLEKVNNDLLIDLNRDGVAIAEDDLKIANFFNSQGEAGKGLIEGINNILGSQIVDYFAPNSTDEESTIHRFFRTDIGAHFYTTSKAEKKAIIDRLPQYAYEGESYQGVNNDDLNDPLSGAKPVYRFLNTTTGMHLYTMDEGEKDYVMNNLDSYIFEDVAYHAYDTPQENTTELYRFYQTLSGSHFYTPSVAEKDYIVDNLSHYQMEGNNGVAFYVQAVDS